MENVLLWGGFHLLIFAMLALDLGVFHRKAEVQTIRQALAWSSVWILIALLFNLGVYLYAGPQAGLEFLTGYLIEKSLSVDNIFVILMIFSYFNVPAKYQHRVLFWGILGALVMRLTLILLGAALIHQFDWIFYVFGAFLVFTGIRMAMHEETEIHPENNPVVKLLRRVMPVTRDFVGNRFFVKEGGKTYATPMFLALLMVETSDLIFAVDSIPAIFAVTSNVFIVYTSNVFAILGLRSLYFALAGIAERFHYLRFGLAAILVFVGAKMLLLDVYKIPVGVALGVVGLILAVSMAVSWFLPSPHKKQELLGDLATQIEDKEKPE